LDQVLDGQVVFRHSWMPNGHYLTTVAMGALAVASNRLGADRLSGKDGEKALRSLTSIERHLCGRLVARQFTHRPTIERDIQKYGLEGMVKLCSAQAVAVYMAVIAVPAVSFAVAGEGVVAVPVFVCLWLLFVLVLGRCFSAARSGRRWRHGGIGASLHDG
jgi:hypothetical protein